MNAKETKVWRKNGTFFGSGVGVGTGGLGVGVGAGLYSESGEEQTKRAETFRMPEKFSAPIGGILISGVCTMASLTLVPEILVGLSLEKPANPNAMSHMADYFHMILSALPLFVVPMIGLCMMLMLYASTKEAERINRDVFPHYLRRYQELRYCERCHLLFDNKGRSADGGEDGFAQMMSY